MKVRDVGSKVELGFFNRGKRS